jgi:hypothetical protein
VSTDVDDAQPVGLPLPETLAVSADLDLGRLINRALLPAARTFGIPYEGIAIADLCQQIYSAVATTRGGPLDSATFKAVCEIRAVLSPRAETAAS